jgi:hypothetical protein
MDNDQEASFTLETVALTPVDWSQVRCVAFVEYRPGGTAGPYEILQAAEVALGVRRWSVFLPLALGASG